MRAGRKLLDLLMVWPQYLLPHHLLSRIVEALTRIRFRPWKNLLIRVFIRLFHVDMGDAADPDPRAYAHFNAFFTRRLRPDARPVCPRQHAIACPADGAISELGVIREGRLLQAKGRHYSLTALLGGDTHRAAQFAGGRFMTVYLSPRDYHRVHMPADGTLTETVYVPGRLFSVNDRTTRSVPGLFTRNERLVCHFDTPAGPAALVFVGAMLVSGIETVWGGKARPARNRPRRILFDRPGDGRVALARGEEAGRFNMGSTVILLFPADSAEWDPALAAGASVRQGQCIGSFR